MPFAERLNRGKVDVTFNAHLASAAGDTKQVSEAPNDGANVEDFALVENQDMHPWKYMYDKVNEMGECAYGACDGVESDAARHLTSFA